jgi:flagellar hook-associated protein 1 FlgK
MMSLFNILNIGSSSLDAQTTGTSVTGENLANVNNPAYARQQVQLAATNPLNTLIGQEGTGVSAVAITQVRDALLDGQIQAEAGVTGSLNSQQTILQDAEAALNEEVTNNSTSGADSSPNGIAAQLSDFFNSLQSLSSAPADVSQRQSVIGNAQQLATQLNQAASSIAGLAANIKTSIDTGVAGVNSDLAQIANLNKQIIQAQGINGTPNELLDQREQVMEDLATKVNFTTSNDGNGAVSVLIGGVPMVAGVNQIDSVAAAFSPVTGKYLVQDTDTGNFLTLAGGSIEGNITVRDGALQQLQTSLDTLSSQLVTSVNSVYSSGFDLNGNTGQNFFNGTNAATISVNSALLTDPTQFQASGTAGANGDNTVALALAQLNNTPISNLGGLTFTGNYASIVANLGTAAASVNNQIVNNGAMTQMLTNQRSSVSGVNIDEEMTNLMQYQKAYQASAELISTVNQMLQTVVNMKTT